jgi:hypothetical protein
MITTEPQSPAIPISLVTSYTALAAIPSQSHLKEIYGKELTVLA